MIIVVQAGAIGLAANALHPHGLPWRRVPLSETRRIAASEEVLPPKPAAPAGPARTETKPPVRTLAVNPETPAKPVHVPASPTEKPKPTPAAPPKAPGKIPPKTRPSAPTAVHPKTPPARPAEKPRPAPAPAKVEALFTTLPDARALFDRKDAVFVDARHREDYNVEHITGARSIFVEDVETLYDSVLGDVPKDRTIVTYCSDPQCGTAIGLADALVARGHTRVFILLEGLPGWKDAGYPTTTGANP